jgi:hypothetical protein
MTNRYINEILEEKNINDAEKFKKLANFFLTENLKKDEFLDSLAENKDLIAKLAPLFKNFFENLERKRNNKVYTKNLLSENINRNNCYKIAGQIKLLNDTDNLIDQIINKEELFRNIKNIFNNVVTWTGFANALEAQQKKSSFWFVFEDFLYAKDIDDAIFLRDKNFEILNKQNYYFLDILNINSITNSLTPIFQFDTNKKNLFEFDFKNEKTVEAWGVDLREAINNYKKGNWIDHTTTFESFSSSDAGESEFEIKIKNI